MNNKKISDVSGVAQFEHHHTVVFFSLFAATPLSFLVLLICRYVTYRGHWRTVDLVTLDLMMPKLSGYDLFEELRKINPVVKVAISSGCSAEEKTRELRKKLKSPPSPDGRKAQP